MRMIFKGLGLFSLLFLLISCSHPDSNNNDRHKGSKFTINDESQYTTWEEPIVADSTHSVTTPIEAEGHHTTLDMEQADGVKYVWVEINGVRLKFIFDTGASDIFISPAEAMVLIKQGTLDENDFLGTQEYQDATGRVSEGTVVNLKSVKIGNKILYNVKASISDNETSPLLLGQSVLERFGKIEIDNINQEIIFK